jgi:isoleucyl-tRNA synthetase
MVSNRPDWCVSRQRSWGVPITIIKCNDCGEFIDDAAVLDSVVRLVEENGADIWFIKEVEELIPSDYTCKKCGHNKFSKEKDILDVGLIQGSAMLLLWKMMKGSAGLLTCILRAATSTGAGSKVHSLRQSARGGRHLTGQY